MIPDKYKDLNNYISQGQKDLLNQGFHLLEYVQRETADKFDDYSFVVFPFAKAYEGFLKQIFVGIGFISEKDYISDHFRIGKVLSPNLVRRLGDKSVYKKICDEVSCDISDQIWVAWKKGRNEVFHYFPHNLRSLTLHDAQERINYILDTMVTLQKNFSIQHVKNKLLNKMNQRIRS